MNPSPISHDSLRTFHTTLVLRNTQRSRNSLSGQRARSILSQWRDKYRERWASFKHVASIKSSCRSIRARAHAGSNSRSNRDAEEGERERPLSNTCGGFSYTARHRLMFSLREFTKPPSRRCVSPRILDGFLRARIYICRWCFRLNSTTNGLNVPCHRRCCHCNSGDLLPAFRRTCVRERGTTSIHFTWKSWLATRE